MIESHKSEIDAKIAEVRYDLTRGRYESQDVEIRSGNRSAEGAEGVDEVVIS
jgi:hypothetical protein